MKLALGLAGLVCLVAAPASAEHWLSEGVQGTAPARQVPLVDRDAVDRTNPRLPKLTFVMLLEKPATAGARLILTDYEIDCAARTSRPTAVQGLSETGALAFSAPVANRPGQAIPPDTTMDALRLGACENRWQGRLVSLAGKSLATIAAESFAR